MTHRAEVTAALEAGLPVYLEKPPAMNQAEMLEMARLAEQKGLLLQTGTNHVFHPSVQFVKGLIDRGEMGTVYAVELHKTIRRFYRKGWHRQKAIAGGGRRDGFVDTPDGPGAVSAGESRHQNGVRDDLFPLRGTGPNRTATNRPTS